jgi:hypothetical protein
MVCSYAGENTRYNQRHMAMTVLVDIGFDVIHHLLLHIGRTIGWVIDLGAMDTYRVDDHPGVGAYLLRLASRPWVVLWSHSEKNGVTNDSCSALTISKSRGS